MALVQKNGGGVSLNASIVTSLGSATTAGNTILIFATGAGTITTPAGFTSRSPQVNIQGFYLFEKLVASGNSTDTPTLTMSGAFDATWLIAEYSGITAFDTSNGNNAAFSGGTSVTTPSITPASGSKLLVAVVAATASPSTATFAAGDPQSWTNSFIGEQSVAQTGGGGSGQDSLISGWSDQFVTASGSSYSTTASFTSSGTAAPASIIAAYTVAATVLVAPKVGLGLSKYPIPRGPFHARFMPQPASIVSAPAPVSLSGFTYTMAPTLTAMSSRTSLSALGKTNSTNKASVFSNVSFAAKTVVYGFGKAIYNLKSALSAKVLASWFSKAGSASSTPLLAKTLVASLGKAGQSVKFALSAKALAASFGKASSSSVTGLSAKSLATSFGSAGISAASSLVSILARGFSSLRGAAGISSRTGLSGTGRSHLTGRAAGSWAAKASAASLATARAAAGSLNRVSASARSFAALTAKAGASFPSRLSGTATGMWSGRLAPPTGKVSLAGASLAALFGKMVKPGAIAIVAASFSRWVGSAGISGKVPMSGTLKVTSSAKAGSVFNRFLSGTAYSAGKASAGIRGLMNLAGTAKVQSSGKAIYNRFATLSATGRSAARSSANAAGVLSLRGRTAIVSFGRSALSTVSPLSGLTARSFSRLVTRTSLGIFAISSRIANTIAEMRSADTKARSVPSVSENRIADTASENRTATTSEEDRS